MKRGREAVSMSDVDELAKGKISIKKSSKKSRPNRSQSFFDILSGGLKISHRPADPNNVYEQSKEFMISLEPKNIPGKKNTIFRTPAFNFSGKVGNGGYLGRNYINKNVEPEKSKEYVYLTIDAPENALDGSYAEMQWAKNYFEDLKDLGECMRKIFEEIYDYFLYTSEIQSTIKLQLLMRELTDEEQDLVNLDKTLSNGNPDLSEVPKKFIERIRNSLISHNECSTSIFRRLGEDGKGIKPFQLHKKYGKEYPTNRYYDNFIEIPGTRRQLIFNRTAFSEVGVDAIINTFPSEVIEECRKQGCNTFDQKREFIQNYYASKYSCDFEAIKNNMDLLEDPVKRRYWMEANGYKLKPVKVYTNQNKKFVLVDFEKLKQHNKSAISYGDIIRCFVDIKPWSGIGKFGIKGVLGNQGYIFVAQKPPDYTDFGDATDEMSYYGDYNNNNENLSNDNQSNNNNNENLSNDNQSNNNNEDEDNNDKMEEEDGEKIIEDCIESGGSYNNSDSEEDEEDA